jgi:transcription elongation factor Elf1
MFLEPADGPECPRCGCRDSKIVEAGNPAGWFARQGRARCGACGLFFAVSAPAAAARQPAISREMAPAPEASGPVPHAVIYRPVRCPQCGGKKCPVKSTKGRIRNHKCSQCGHAFKSVEEE